MSTDAEGAGAVSNLCPQAPGVIAEWDLSSVNLGRVAGHSYDVAVVPTSAIEPHNRHLPYGQDFLHGAYIARRCCEAAARQSPNIACLPGVPYGVDSNLMDFPMTIHVSQTALNALLRDIIISLKHHGVRKIVVINSHGGNDFGSFVRQIQSDLEVFVFIVDWWKVAEDCYEDIFEKPDDHGGEFETSVALALWPQLVEGAQAGDGMARPFRFEALRRGWARTSRNFAKLNDHAGVGDPSKAEAEKGRRYLDLVCERITDFLVELGESPIDESFPQQP